MNKKLVLPSLILVVFSMLPSVVEAATLYLMPQSQTVYKGDSFIVEVRLNTEGKEINTVGADLIFPNLIEAVDFSEGNSILTLWPKKPTIQQQTGSDQGQELISFVGGTPQGFIGDGLILNITFKAKELGKAQVDFGENSKVLLNDGRGTETKLLFLEGNYTISGKTGEFPRISSRTHPDQNKWYNKSTLSIRWDWKEEILYSYLLTHDPLAIPDENPDKPEGELMWIGEMEYRNLEDGVYYFHLRQTERGEGQELAWGPKATFRLMIDTIPPEEFIPAVGKDEAVFDGKYFLSFATKDGLSGIEHYEVLEMSDKQQEVGEWKAAITPYLLEDQTLSNIIRVKAVDKAGNERMTEILPPQKPFPYKNIIAVLAGVGVAIGVTWWVLKRIIAKSAQSKRQEY